MKEQMEEEKDETTSIYTIRRLHRMFSVGTGLKLLPSFNIHFE
jgi:hypothetical protein